MRFSVLGPLEVTTSAGPVVIRARRVRALLGILLLYVGKVVPIEFIVDGIWAERPPRSVIENIRTYVSQLRSLLREAGDHPRLQSHPGGYRLLAEPEELDLLRFSALAADGRQALHRGDHGSAAALLGEAIDLWRGTPLAELDAGTTVRAKLLALDEQRWRVQFDCIRAHLALGHHAELLPRLRELLAERPLDETIWCFLAAALSATGRTAEALSACQDARRTLRNELGIELGPELRNIEAALLKGGDSLRNVVTGRSTGTPHVGAPHQLPAGARQLVGRDVELGRIRDLVQAIDGQHPQRPTVIVVCGPPGVGKTSLAIAAAIAVETAVPDGQLYVDLRGSGSPGKLLDAAHALTLLLDAFGVRGEAILEGLERRRLLYRSLLADRRILVLLDDATETGQLAPLIPGPGRSVVIVTSRRRLAGLAADEHLVLEPLAREHAVRMLANIVGSERVRSEPGAAADIVEACGRLPSAVRIAAERIAARPLHPLRILAERLRAEEDVLDELTLDGASMRALFEATYRTLDARTQRCFRALARMDAAEITAQALSVVLELPAAVADRELERLVHEGLLMPADADHDAPRYRVSTLVRAYARDRLETEETSAAPSADAGPERLPPSRLVTCEPVAT